MQQLTAHKTQQEASQELMKKLSALEAQQEAVREQFELNRQLMQELTALKTDMTTLRESGSDGRLARIAK